MDNDRRNEARELTEAELNTVSGGMMRTDGALNAMMASVTTNEPTTKRATLDAKAPA